MRAASRYRLGVGIYVVTLLSVQSFMGVGIDWFKETWGETTLEVVAYVLVAVGAAAILAVGAKLWPRTTTFDRIWIFAAAGLYAAGTLSARSPQERLHYIGYGALAGLLYFGFAEHGRSPHRPAAAGSEADVSDTGLERPDPSAHRRGLGSGSWWALAAVVLLVGGGIGLLDEVLQIWWPRRYFDWQDVGINLLSVALGLLVAVPAHRATRGSKP